NASASRLRRWLAGSVRALGHCVAIERQIEILIGTPAASISHFCPIILPCEEWASGILLPSQGSKIKNQCMSAPFYHRGPGKLILICMIRTEEAREQARCSF